MTQIPGAHGVEELLALIAHDAQARERLRSLLPADPTRVVRPELAEEIGGPTLALLKDLNLLEDDAERFRWWEGTPFGKQAITSGATGLAKVVAPGVGIPGLAAGIVGWIKGWGMSTHADWVLLGCATVVLVATALAVAIIGRADLAARAHATAAQYDARAATAAAYLSACHASAAPPLNEVRLAFSGLEPRGDGAFGPG